MIAKKKQMRFILALTIITMVSCVLDDQISKIINYQIETIINKRLKNNV
jgi:hypothetical protein